MEIRSEDETLSAFLFFSTTLSALSPSNPSVRYSPHYTTPIIIYLLHMVLDIMFFALQITAYLFKTYVIKPSVKEWLKEEGTECDITEPPAHPFIREAH